MNNSQTIQENNERISAVVELLKTKAAGEPVDLTEIENAIAELFGETTNLHDTLNTRVENVYFIDNGYKANPAEEYTDTNAVLWAANVVLRPGDYLINKHLYKYIVDTVEHTETGFTFTYHFVESLVPDLYLETANLWNKYTTLVEKVPVKLSQLENDTNFITSTVENLANYYSKAEVNGLVNAISKFSALIVTTLPTSNISTTTIYLVAKTDSEANDYYDEYLYINNAWEMIGNTKIDLSNYYTKEEITSLLSAYAKAGDIPTALSQLTNDAGYTDDTTANNIANNTTIIAPKDGETASLFMGSFTDNIISNNRGSTRGTAIGNNAKIGNYGTAVGNLSDAGNQGVAVGRDSASSDYGVAIGYYSLGAAGVAVGHSARGYNLYSVAIGRNAKAENNGAIQIGYGTNSTANSVQFRNDNVYNTETHTLTVQNAQVGGSDVVTKANFILDGTTLTITI